MTATAPAPIFPWKDAYSVRIPEIDAQHKILIRLINELHAAMLCGQAAGAMAGIMDELVRYTDIHFRHEEALLERRRYSGLAAHSQAHARLAAEVRERCRKVRGGKLTVTLELMTFLKGWLANHILSADRDYAREING